MNRGFLVTVRFVPCVLMLLAVGKLQEKAPSGRCGCRRSSGGGPHPTGGRHADH